MNWTNLLPIIIEGLKGLPDILKSIEKLVEIFGSNKKNGDNKSAVYEAMSDEGKKKVDGLRNALNLAKEADDRQAAGKVLRKLANIYSEEAVSMAANSSTSKLAPEATTLSKSLRILADKVEKTNHPLPGGNRVGKNTHDQIGSDNQIIVANSHNISISTNDTSVAKNGNNKMYALAMNSLKENAASGDSATPLDIFKVMVDHDVPAQKAKEIVIFHNPDIKDSLAASIDKQIDNSKLIKEKSSEIASDSDIKQMNKQEQLVA
jgi:hypothetical protein